MTVGCSKLQIPPTKVRRPKKTVRQRHQDGIQAFDVSPTDSHGLATGGRNGSLLVSDWAGGTAPAVEARGVVGDITDIRFFPSGEVLLVSATDMRTRVFGVQGSNPRTLEGHTRSVEACVPLPPKGRLVLTAARDATVKLWRVADAQCLHTFPVGSPANAVAIGKRPPGFEGGIRPPNGDEGDAETELAEMEAGLIALVALGSGSVAVLDLATRTILSTIASSAGSDSSALTIDYHSDSGLIATGHTDGAVVLRRLPEREPLVSFTRATRASVQSVLFSSTEPTNGWPTLLVGGEDGLPWRAAFSDGGDDGVKVYVAEEYMGIDTDSVCALREGPGGIFAGSADSCIRRW